MAYKSEPAFPAWELNGQGQPEMTCFGMTIRDYFAAKAMQWYLANWPERQPIERQRVAEWAYDMADAMIEEREKKDD